MEISLGDTILLAEAKAVRDETGLTPRQLADLLVGITQAKTQRACFAAENHARAVLENGKP